MDKSKNLFADSRVERLCFLAHLFFVPLRFFRRCGLPGVRCGLDATSNTRLERTRHERASLLSCVGEPLKRSVSWPSISLKLMRRFALLSLLLLTLGLSGCSYSTDFVLVNEANYSILVTYKIKPVPKGPPSIDVEPSVVSTGALEARDKSKWIKLTSDRYRIDQINRTVTVTLGPREALWLTSMFHYIGDEDPNDVESFPIQEVSMAGSDGEMKFSGDKARKAFERVSRVLYVLRYK